MAEIITLSIQKGGTGKSTTTGALAYLLSEKYGLKTLVVDFDPQGNQTEMLARTDTEEFENHTILEATELLDPRDYVVEITNNLYLIPSDDNLGIFPRRLFQRYFLKDDQGRALLDSDGEVQLSVDASLVLKRTLEPIQEYFDVILIDTPPMLSDYTANALIASTGCVVIYQTHKFCYTAVRRFLETVRDCQVQSNPDLKLYGILPSMTNKQRSDTTFYLEMIRKKYGDMVFKTTIKHQAAVARIPIFGLDPEENAELKKALEQFDHFAVELLDRIKNKTSYEITEELLERG
ncbi:ParA family protein [Risungbinella massiliensis]|uniref:ParA family protein n=1 Tax=Risungbinella massiliensis TaxID=1329796 RepID=UPI0005CBE720|nr:ParA family protein [Risungbinella massiliensis]